MKIIKSQKGVTLLEVILVLAIGGTILLLSLSTYQSMQSQKDIEAVQYNVDTLFTAMGNYYHANCGITTHGGTTAAGPLVTTTTPQDISLLTLTPYLPSQWVATGSTVAAPPFNALVNNTGTTSPGYVMQFNLTMESTSTNCLAKDCTTQQNISIPSPLSAITMRAQVAIFLKGTTAQVKALAAQLSADCISSWNGTNVDTCESNPTAGNYLVWERLPSLAAPVTTSSLWVSMPILKEFNLQYTHDQMNEITSKTYIDNGSGIAQEYYTCGS